MGHDTACLLCIKRCVGIPPDLDRTFNEERLRYQVLPFYNALYANPDGNYGAQCTFALRDDTACKSSEPHTPTTRSNRSSTVLSPRELKRSSFGSIQHRSFHRSDADFSIADQQKGYKTFPPGVFEYVFEIPLDHTCPESAELPEGSVRWKLEVLIERAGVLKPNLHGCKEILVVRAPDQNSLEQVEPIAISRKWEDQLYYDIVISGKSFALGSKIPITFKLTPLAKVQCHRIRVLLTENITYICPDRGVTKKDSQRRILLLERHAGKALAKEYESSDVRVTSGGELPEQERTRVRAMAQQIRDQEAEKKGRPPRPLPPPSDNLLGDLDLGLEHLISQTEIEMNVQLPTCNAMRRDKSQLIHPNISCKNIQIYHWIKVNQKHTDSGSLLTRFSRLFCVFLGLIAMTRQVLGGGTLRFPSTRPSIFSHASLLKLIPPSQNIRISARVARDRGLNADAQTRP
jgi:arrestin-related trafficking adapter 3/6